MARSRETCAPWCPNSSFFPRRIQLPAGWTKCWLRTLQWHFYCSIVQKLDRRLIQTITSDVRAPDKRQSQLAVTWQLFWLTCGLINYLTRLSNELPRQKSQFHATNGWITHVINIGPPKVGPHKWVFTPNWGQRISGKKQTLFLKNGST